MTLPVRLSVAIATLGRADELSGALAALADGDLPPEQVIIVDQSEGTATRTAVAAWRDRLPVLYLHSRRRGLARSRNLALMHVTCPYIAFTDDDCMVHPRWTAVVKHGFAATAAPDVICGRVLPAGSEDPQLFAVSTRDSIHPASFTGRARPWEAGTGGNLAASVESLRGVGGFDERLGAGAALRAGEDVDLLYRLLRSGAMVRYDPDAVVYHRRQTRERRIASRYGYGLGMGAFLGFHLRRRDRYAARLLVDWITLRGWATAGALRRHRWPQLYEEALFLTGTVIGVARGVAAGPAKAGPSTAPC
jgi:GT2 family glycosyltransferase